MSGGVLLLASCIPELDLDGVAVHLHRFGRKVDSDGRPALLVESVAGESAQKVGLANS